MSKFRDKAHLGLGEADGGERRDDDEQTSEDRRLLVSGLDPANVAALYDGHQAADEQKHLALFDISRCIKLSYFNSTTSHFDVAFRAKQAKAIHITRWLL